VLDAGPAAWGWADQCWTLARIGELVRERFGADYTLAGMDAPGREAMIWGAYGAQQPSSGGHGWQPASENDIDVI
jgi:Winged helix-turn helix